MSAPNGAALLSIRDLTTQIRHESHAITVVDRSSLEIGRREVLALIGESGSGKTMTAMSILRLIAPPVSITGGEVWYQGRDLLRLPTEAMRDLRGREIAMIFQNPRDRFDPLRTIGYQLIEVLQHHGSLSHKDAFDRAIELLKEVQLVNV